MEKDDKAKRSGSAAWSWKSRRLLRARIHSRYEHVSRRGWRVHRMIYIPAAAEHHISKAQRADQSTLLQELDRLAALNVPWACAILGYFALLLREDGSRDIERAVSLCQEPARAGDAYAQYVLSWALRLKGDEGAYGNMKKSAHMLFPPAVLDIAGFYSRDWDADRIKDEQKRHLAISDRVGHAFTLARRLQFYRSGRFGALNLILGYFLMPCALVRLILPMNFSPHSATVCFFDPRLSTKAIEVK